MQKVHKPEKRKWISGHFNLRAVRDEWCSGLYNANCFWNCENDLLEPLNLPEEVLEKAAKDTRIDLLDCDGELDIELTRKFDPPPLLNLEAVKLQKQELDKRLESSRYRLFAYNNYKYFNYPVEKPIGNKKTAKPESSELVNLPEILLTVEVYRPEISLKRCKMALPSRVPSFVVDQEFCIVGSQYLTELRDVIECVSDHVIPGDFSDNPCSTENQVKCKDLMKSGFFYIDGVFYNDMRDPCAIDYSKTILDWAGEKDRGIGPFICLPMEHRQFIDLTIQIGYPYVYVHQGYCEHLIVFSDLRMMNMQDSLRLSDYPLVNRLNAKKQNYCMSCHTYTTKWIVTKNVRLPQDIYFACDDCFYAFNYDEEGKKIGKFEARKYVDRTLIT